MSSKVGVVSRPVAEALYAAGFPQEMRVGDYGYHPMSGLVRLVRVRPRPRGVLPVDNPVLRAPSVGQAQAWMQENNLVFPLTPYEVAA